MTHQLQFAARSDRGLLRSNNQDSVYAGERLLIVADGMGGHAAGDLASRVVVAAFVPLDAAPPGADPLVPLKQALLDGNDAIAEMVQDDPDLDGMGTTATAMLFDGDRMGMVHIGDSRAYLYRNGVLHQLSRDDTFVQSLVDDGRITEDEAAHHPQRNLLLRALNGAEPEPMLTVREISTGDRFLLCSDGLSSVVAAEAIADALADPDPESAADRLIELALVAGGPDNVTVIVADVVDVGARSAAPLPAGPVDPEATGPIKPIHATQRMPRIPLPAIPEDVPARPDYLDGDPLSPGGRGGTDGRRFAGAGIDDPDDDDHHDDGDDHDDDAAGRVPERIPGARTATPRPTHRRGLLTAIVSAIVVLALAAAGSLVWTRSQYYVGAADGRVVLFRGVPGSVLGISLASVQEDSCTGVPSPCTPIKVDELMPAARDLVNQGIESPSLQKARAVMARLPDQLLPCGAVRTPNGQPTGSGSATSGGSASAAGTSSAGASGPPITVSAPPLSPSLSSSPVSSSSSSKASSSKASSSKALSSKASASSVPPRRPPRTLSPPPRTRPVTPTTAGSASAAPKRTATTRTTTRTTTSRTAPPRPDPTARATATALASQSSEAVNNVTTPGSGDRFQRRLIAPDQLQGGAVALDRTAGSSLAPATPRSITPSMPGSAPPTGSAQQTGSALSSSSAQQTGSAPSSSSARSTGNAPPTSSAPSSSSAQQTGSSQQNCRVTK